MNALVLVDLQNDFLPGGALAVPQGDAVLPVARDLIHGRRFDLVVATQDLHPPEHQSFAANHPGRRPYETLMLNGLLQVLWPVHCVVATSGAALAGALADAPIDAVFPKGTDPTIDSYSGFFDNGRRKSTGLSTYLEAHRVDAVYVLGLATDYCVLHTALDAQSLGLRTHLIQDGCRGVDLVPGDVDRALGRMRDAGIILTDSTSLRAGPP